MERTELVDFPIRPGRMPLELAAGGIDDLNPLLMVLLVHVLQILIAGHEPRSPSPY